MLPPCTPAGARHSAKHGGKQLRPPHYAKFAMQNYKTEEDIWKLVSPPCGIKGEGAFAQLFAGRSANSGEEAAPVVVFDEIEEVRTARVFTMLPNRNETNPEVAHILRLLNHEQRENRVQQSAFPCDKSGSTVQNM